MLFNSFIFFEFFLFLLMIYYIPFFKNFQIEILIGGSILFYGYSQPWLLSLLFLSILINSTAAYRVFINNEKSKQKIWAIYGVIANLLILIFFKYNHFIASMIINDLQNLNETIKLLLSIPLPIGISFYTFQGISLVVDVFKQKQGNNIDKIVLNEKFLPFLKKVAFFKVFFPQLVSGPIVKAHDFMPQIKRKYIYDIDFDSMSQKLIIGYFLKLVVANNLHGITGMINLPFCLGYSSLTLLFFLFAYSIQIYADFAGYSLIAIGLAEAFGYKFPDNFNFPYISQSLSEFWTRWHISLSSFLREYLYIPLGGNRKGILRTQLNLMIVMFLGGLWHGGAWSYAIWGSWHGLGLILERPFINTDFFKSQNILIKILRVIIVFTFVSIAWLLFKLPNFNDVIIFVETLLQNKHLRPTTGLILPIIFYSSPVFLAHFLYFKGVKMHVKLNSIAYALMLFFIIVNTGEQNAFIYFQF